MTDQPMPKWIDKATDDVLDLMDGADNPARCVLLVGAEIVLAHNAAKLADGPEGVEP